MYTFFIPTTIQFEQTQDSAKYVLDLCTRTNYNIVKVYLQEW